MTIFYSVLFSLGDPKTNLYCYLPAIQKRALEATGNLKGGSTYALICDESSAAYLRQFHLLRGVKIFPVPRPRTVLEGMSLKYILPGLLDLKDETVVYLDLDILPLRNVAFTNVSPDSLVVLPEGKATESNYCGDTPLHTPIGLSAGLFIYRDGPTVRAFFKRMLQAISTCQKNFYTLDQPYFNHFLEDINSSIRLMPQGAVSFNGHGDLKNAAFVNLCGDPGDGPLHFQKVLEFFLSAFIRA